MYFHISNGIARGPGVCDMKQGVTETFFILVALKHFGFTERPVKAVFVPDEEISHVEGIADEILMQEAKGALRCFNMETGRMDNCLTVGRKGGISIIAFLFMVGGSMLSLGSTLIALAISLSFALPFLTDAGLMEFPGIILKPVVRPLFRVPGRASLDLVASWLASSNTAVLITGSQYHTGFYSRREAATIMTNFSLVSIPFCMVVAETLKLNDRFPLLYGIITLIGLFLAIIGCRIYPLGTIPDAYCGEKRIREDIPPNYSLIRWAFEVAAERASRFSIFTALQGGWTMAVGIVFDIIPIVIAWGTIGTILVNETPIFQFLSYPMGMYMDLLGVEQAYATAPQTVVGFIDMFIPALITSPDLPEKTRFLVAGISLVQIIYMTEVGSIIIKADVGLDFKSLIIIFLERTIIAIPLIVLATKLFL